VLAAALIAAGVVAGCNRSTESRKTDEVDRAVTLLKAAGQGDVPTLQRLLDEGMDVDTRGKDGWTPLMLAAGAGQQPAVELLLARGADVKAHDVPGATALSRAAGGGHRAIVELLIAKGADVNADAVSGWTPLMTAARRASSPGSATNGRCSRGSPARASQPARVIRLVM